MKGRERERGGGGGGGSYLSDNSVPQQVWREDLVRHGDRPYLAWKQFSKLIDVREREGDHTCQTKVVPPASPEGEDMQTN